MIKKNIELTELVFIQTWGCWLKKPTKNNSGSNWENQVIVVIMTSTY